MRKSNQVSSGLPYFCNNVTKSAKAMTGNDWHSMVMVGWLDGYG